MGCGRKSLGPESENLEAYLRQEVPAARTGPERERPQADDPLFDDDEQAVLRRDEVFDEVNDERHRQDEKFGDQIDNSLGLWNAILGEEAGEVQKEVCALLAGRETGVDCGGNVAELRKELIQTAAVAVAFVEYGDRNGWWSLPEG